MGNNGDLPLLDFVDSDTRASAVLVIESTGYLPALRKMFPEAELFAVAADEEAACRPELEGLGVRWEILDYRETVLPFPRHSFDIVISERMLENVMNPQDIASGIGTFIKDTGFLLTSFENIRYWRVLQELMDGHFYAIVHRRYAKPEFERLLYASFYKDIFFSPVRKPGADGVIEKLVAAGFENRLGCAAVFRRLGICAAVSRSFEICAAVFRGFKKLQSDRNRFSAECEFYAEISCVEIF